MNEFSRSYTNTGVRQSDGETNIQWQASSELYAQHRAAKMSKWFVTQVLWTMQLLIFLSKPY